MTSDKGRLDLDLLLPADWPSWWCKVKVLKASKILIEVVEATEFYFDMIRLVAVTAAGFPRL